jgi:hypothetical protein
MLVVAVLFYVFLWVLAINGASEPRGPSLIPAVVLAVLVILGVALQRYMGLTPRKPALRDPDRAATTRAGVVNEIQDDAVVLRTYKSGESDRVVVLWTRHGKSASSPRGSARPPVASAARSRPWPT